MTEIGDDIKLLSFTNNNEYLHALDEEKKMYHGADETFVRATQPTYNSYGIPYESLATQVNRAPPADIQNFNYNEWMSLYSRRDPSLMSHKMAKKVTSTSTLTSHNNDTRQQASISSDSTNLQLANNACINLDQGLLKSDDNYMYTSFNQHDSNSSTSNRSLFLDQCLEYRSSL